MEQQWLGDLLGQTGLSQMYIICQPIHIKSYKGRILHPWLEEHIDTEYTFNNIWVVEHQTEERVQVTWWNNKWLIYRSITKHRHSNQSFLYTCLGLTDPMDQNGIAPGHNRWPVFFLRGLLRATQSATQVSWGSRSNTKRMIEISEENGKSLRHVWISAGKACVTLHQVVKDAHIFF